MATYSAIWIARLGSTERTSGTWRGNSGSPQKAVHARAQRNDRFQTGQGFQKSRLRAEADEIVDLFRRDRHRGRPAARHRRDWRNCPRPARPSPAAAGTGPWASRRITSWRRRLGGVGLGVAAARRPCRAAALSPAALSPAAAAAGAAAGGGAGGGNRDRAVGLGAQEGDQVDAVLGAAAGRQSSSWCRAHGGRATSDI